MKRALFAKFQQSPSLQQLLISTENRQLIEASPEDSYWGEGRDRNGMNYLGFLLMQVRYELWGIFKRSHHNPSAS